MKRLELQRPTTWPDLRRDGFTRREVTDLIRVGLLRRVLRNVYAPAHLEDTTVLRADAARLVLPEHAVLCDRTASWLHGVDRYTLEEMTEVPPLEVASTRGASRLRRDGTAGCRRDLEPADICAVNGVPVTTAARTACDLARRWGRRDALATLDAFMRTCELTLENLLAVVPRLAGRRGVVQLRELVALADPRAESPGESWTRMEIIDAGLKIPVPQYWVLADGMPLFRIDLAYPSLRIAVEYDGEEFHSRDEDKAHDKKRREWLRRHGWVVIVVTKEDFARGSDERWLGELREAIAERAPRTAKRRYARAERAWSR